MEDTKRAHRYAPVSVTEPPIDRAVVEVSILACRHDSRPIHSTGQTSKRPRRTLTSEGRLSREILVLAWEGVGRYKGIALAPVAHVDGAPALIGDGTEVAARPVGACAENEGAALTLAPREALRTDV